VARVKTPSTNSEYKETCEKFRNRIKNDPKDSSVCRVLADTEYEAKLEIYYPQWLALEMQATELAESLRIVKDKKEKVLNDHLRPILIDIKDLVVVANKKSPLLNNLYGFPTTLKPAKKLTQAEVIEADAKRLAVKVNAFEETQAIAQKSSANVSVTVNDVTKSMGTGLVIG
jgi:hypothetical protein